MKTFRKVPNDTSMGSIIPDSSRDDEWEELELEPEDLADDEQEEVVEVKSSIDDSVQLYLQEIGQVALLTAEEEVTLAKQVTEAQQAQQLLLNNKNLSWMERFSLERACNAGDEARRKLIQANLRLVVSVA